MLFMLGREYGLQYVRCLCDHQCSFEIDVCPSCKHNLRLLCECDTCRKRFWYKGQEQCPNCGATLPNYEDNVPKIEMVIAKNDIRLSYRSKVVDTPNAYHRDHALLSAKDPRVQAAVRSFDIPKSENIYTVVIADNRLTNNCKGFAICERGVYCRDIDQWHGLIRWNDFADKQNMQIKALLGLLWIGSHSFSITKHADCSCSDLKNYLQYLQICIRADNVEWYDEDEEDSQYYEEEEESPTSSPGMRSHPIL